MFVADLEMPQPPAEPALISQPSGQTKISQVFLPRINVIREAEEAPAFSTGRMLGQIMMF